MSDTARRMIRTALQTLLGLLAALPLLVDSGSLPGDLPGLAVAVTVSTAVTRIMALPFIDALLPSWLRREAPAAPQSQPPAPATPPESL